MILSSVLACHQRAYPPLNRRISVNDTYRGFVLFSFAEL